MTPSGFIAVLAGWFVTEIGRQPYVVYGFVRTADVVSKGIVAEKILFSLTAFAVTYFIIFGAATYYILRLIAKGVQKL